MPLFFVNASPLKHTNRHTNLPLHVTQNKGDFEWLVSLSCSPSAAVSGSSSVSKDFLKGALLYLLAAVFLALGTALPARAVTYPYPAVLMYRAEFSYEPKFTGPWQTSYSLACDDMARLYGTIVDPGWKYVVTSCSTTSGAFRIATQTKVPANSYSGTIPKYLRCPQGGIVKVTGYDVGVCNANPNDVPSGPDCTDKNPMIRRFNYGIGPYTTPDHFGECVVKPTELKVCRKENGSIYCMWQVERTGEVYKGTDVPGSGAGGDQKAEDVPSLPPVPSPPLLPPKQPDIRPDSIPCPKGSVQAGINSDGVPICVGTGTNPAPAPTKPETTTSTPQTTTNADGSSVTVVTTTQKNSDGSVTTTTRTTTRGVDGSETVKVEGSTTKTPSGAQGATDTPEKDQYDLCKQNPTLSICRNSSVSGSCGEITCQGDAIQCATLRAAAAMQCQQQKELEELKNAPSKQLGDAIQAGNDPMKGQIEAAMKGDEVDLSKPQLDQTGFLGGGGCIPPKTMHVAGHAIPVDFTQVCEDIQPLRAAIMACAFIIAYLIVARSVLDS